MEETVNKRTRPTEFDICESTRQLYSCKHM